MSLLKYNLFLLNGLVKTYFGKYVRKGFQYVFIPNTSHTNIVWNKLLDKQLVYLLKWIGKDFISKYDRKDSFGLMGKIIGFHNNHILDRIVFLMDCPKGVY